MYELHCIMYALDMHLMRADLRKKLKNITRFLLLVDTYQRSMTANTNLHMKDITMPNDGWLATFIRLKLCVTVIL